MQATMATATRVRARHAEGCGVRTDRDRDRARIVAAFSAYMEHEGHGVTRAQFEENIALKLRDSLFTADISPLLAADVTLRMEDGRSGVVATNELPAQVVQ